MQRILNIVFVSIILLFSNSDILCAQTSRPKVGVVLSGGGAVGFAHVGVLKVLEEVGMPIDYIGGTSMGSIIGGLYAVGYKSDSIQKLIKSQNWIDLFTDKIERKYLSFDDKANDGKFFIAYPLKDGKFKLPSGMLSGQQLELLLSRLFWDYLEVNDFSKLPIPFLCVATDIEAGKPVTFTKGYLPKAIRASMAIPTVFDPVVIDGRMFVDGGVYNNFPVEQVKAMGADIIIGVDVGFEPFKGEELNSMLRIIEQTIFMHSVEANNQQRALCNYLIKLHVRNMHMMSFDMADTIISLGEFEARKQLKELKELADSIKSLNSESTNGLNFSARKVKHINKIIIKGNTSIPESYVLAKLNLNVPGYFESKNMEEAINRLYGTQLFNKVEYKIDYDSLSNNASVLIIEVKEKKQFLFSTGINYNTDYNASIFFNSTINNFLVRGSKFSFNVLLGENPRIDVDYFIYRGWIPKSIIPNNWPLRLDFGINFRTNHYQLPVYINQVLQAINGFTDISASIYAQTILLNAYAIGAGIQQEFTTEKADINPFNYPSKTYKLLNLYSFIKFDTYDKTFFPSSGMQIYGELKYLSNAFEKFEQKPTILAHGQYKLAIPLYRRLSLHTHLYSGISFTDSLPTNYVFRTGGLSTYYVKNAFPLVGYRLLEFTANNMMIAALGLQYELARNHFLTARFNLARFDNHWNNYFLNSTNYYGYGFSYGYNSIIGPIMLWISKSPDRALYFYLNVGFMF